MGTRADFYVGRGKNAEWIGSVAWDGYEWGENMDKGISDPISTASNEQEYRKSVSDMLNERKDGTVPDMGWPWPWDDSCTTDCAYCFVDGKVEAYSWGSPWSEEDGNEIEWPNMKDKQNTNFGERSGLIFIKG